jgi:hypothetical protein
MKHSGVLHAAVDQAPMILSAGSAVDAPEPVSFCFARPSAQRARSGQ